MRKKKSFGQHFLKDQSLCQRIVEAAEIEAYDLVIEVGPGQGALTTYLPQDRLTLVELDRELIDGLRDRYPRTSIVQEDATQIDFDALVDGMSWVLVGNLPYNVGNAIIMNALASQNRPKRLVVMVQKEVADRMLAPAGANRSVLSVVMQLYGDVSRVMDVKPGSFQPPPNVMSSVVRLEVNPKVRDPEKVLRIVSAGFSSRRKQLHKNLDTANIASSQDVKTTLTRIGVREDIRAQGLSIDEWVTLAEHVL